MFFSPFSGLLALIYVRLSFPCKDYYTNRTISIYLFAAVIQGNYKYNYRAFSDKQALKN